MLDTRKFKVIERDKVVPFLPCSSSDEMLPLTRRSKIHYSRMTFRIRSILECARSPCLRREQPGLVQILYSSVSSATVIQLLTGARKAFSQHDERIKQSLSARPPGGCFSHRFSRT